MSCALVTLREYDIQGSPDGRCQSLTARAGEKQGFPVPPTQPGMLVVAGQRDRQVLTGTIVTADSAFIQRLAVAIGRQACHYVPV